MLKHKISCCFYWLREVSNDIILGIRISSHIVDFFDDALFGCIAIVQSVSQTHNILSNFWHASMSPLQISKNGQKIRIVLVTVDLGHPWQERGVVFGSNFRFSVLTNGQKKRGNNSEKPLWLLDFSIPRSVCSFFLAGPTFPAATKGFSLQFTADEGNSCERV